MRILYKVEDVVHALEVEHLTCYSYGIVAKKGKDILFVEPKHVSFNDYDFSSILTKDTIDLREFKAIVTTEKCLEKEVDAELLRLYLSRKHVSEAKHATYLTKILDRQDIKDIYKFAYPVEIAVDLDTYFNCTEFTEIVNNSLYAKICL